MKKYGWVMLVCFFFAGCRDATTPYLKIDKASPDSVRIAAPDTTNAVNAVPPLQNTPPDVKIVGGVPAEKDDKAEPEDARAGKEKPGGVEVKMDY